MEMYNATIELADRAESAAAERGDQLLARFADYHAVIGRSLLGYAELVLSLPAEGLWQAVSTVRAITEGLHVTRVAVEASAAFDARSDASVPELLSVSEVADRLGVTRAAVQKRIDKGVLPAVRVGTTWAVPAAAC